MKTQETGNGKQETEKASAEASSSNTAQALPVSPRLSPVSSTVAYLGPKGSFTHEAAERHFGEENATFLSCSSIRETFETVRTEAATFGVVPIESLRQGPVIESYMELKKAGPSRIVGETYLPVQLFLMIHPSATLDTITTLVSKAEAIRQCGYWIDEQQERRRDTGLPPLEIEEVSSTTKAAAMASERPEIGAISSRFSGRFYAVNMVGRGAPNQEGIQDLPDDASYTRFLILGHTSPSRADYGEVPFKTSFRFILAHRTGALVDALLPFQTAGIGLDNIQPMPFRASQRQIEYVFFMDFLGHISDKEMIRAVREAEETCAVEYLGSYPAGQMPRAVLGPTE